jgi:hypothetical protein
MPTTAFEDAASTELELSKKPVREILSSTLERPSLQAVALEHDVIYNSHLCPRCEKSFKSATLLAKHM